MKYKTRSLVKGLAVLIVLLAVLMELEILIVPELMAYKLWLVVIGFAMLLVISR